RHPRGRHSFPTRRSADLTAEGSGLHSVSFGDCLASWADAAQVSAATHVRYLDAPVARVLSLVPAMYGEIWTGAKGFYKVEPVVADRKSTRLNSSHVKISY